MDSTLTMNERLKLRQASSLSEVMDRFKEWLYLEPPDIDVIHVTLASALEREFNPPGDPIWLLVVAPSGGMKSELIRSLNDYPRAFMLDTMTPQTLVSGLTKREKDGTLTPVAGLLRKLDGHVLCLKDFTTILSKSDETRTAIYGQLRACYDGFYAAGFGSVTGGVIRVESSFGIVAGVTPIIDKYTKMTGALGERFLYIRSNPDREKTALRAFGNEGKEYLMREQLTGCVASFFTEILKEGPPPRPPISAEGEKTILDLGLYIGMMRTKVYATYFQGAITDLDAVYSEIPTRVVKQLKKLGQLLAVLRGHSTVEPSELRTLQRVAHDTAMPRRQRIIEIFRHFKEPRDLAIVDIADYSLMMDGLRLHINTVKNEVEIMRVVGILEYDRSNGLYRIHPDFKDRVDTAHHAY